MSLIVDQVGLLLSALAASALLPVEHCAIETGRLGTTGGGSLHHDWLCRRHLRSAHPRFPPLPPPGTVENPTVGKCQDGGVLAGWAGRLRVLDGATGGCVPRSTAVYW